jgi:Arc/MetJ-type ribon-helix-helix transcriptional regulator
MTINLPKEVENSIRAEVQSGHFASADEAIAAAWRAFQRQQRQGREEPEATTTQQEEPPASHKPIWEVIEEENRSIPPEVWDALPTDLSEQHDHYIYGTPKRPAR